jgi:hypothetical protein
MWKCIHGNLGELSFGAAFKECAAGKVEGGDGATKFMPQILCIGLNTSENHITVALRVVWFGLVWFGYLVGTKPQPRFNAITKPQPQPQPNQTKPRKPRPKATCCTLL